MGEEQRHVLEPYDPRIRIAEQNIQILEEWLSEVERIAPESNDSWLLITMLKSTRRAYNHLRNGWLCDSTYTAWACRNLLELRIFSKYIATSPDNRRRFMADLIVDSEQKTEALIKLAFKVTPELIENYSDPHPAIHQKMREKLNFQGNAYLSPSTMATEVGLQEDFRFIFKLCSKLVHPTAQSILSFDLEDQNERDVHLLCGCSYVTAIVDDLIPLAQQLTS